MIVKLDETTVNRIAAGEVVQGQANAIKELIENSIDAGATSIAVTVDGLDMTVRDNGKGIPKTDLPLLCERFATSKLRKFEDLTEIATFGFRGEALASLSHCSRLSVVTKTAAQKVAYRASYKDGQMLKCTPCAGEGTSIIIEDLFYNMRLRKSDYPAILKVVTAYAAHFSTVTFSCRKKGMPEDVVTTPRSVQEALTSLHAKHLVGFSAEGMEGYCSNEGSGMLLFVNNRLVENRGIKRLFDHFWYLSITVPPSEVDVNIHPTKREVQLLNEDAIIQRIVLPTFETQTYEPDTKKSRVEQKVRMAPAAIDAYLPGAFAGCRPVMSFEETRCGYDSVLELIAEMREDRECASKLRKCVFVGYTSKWLLLQSQQDLVAYDSSLLAEMFRQLAIRRFGRTPALIFDPVKVPDVLCKHSDMLLEYFNIGIENGCLTRLPELLPGHQPSGSGIMQFLQDLSNADFTREKPCFDAISRSLGKCYAVFDDNTPVRRTIFPALKDPAFFRIPHQNPIVLTSLDRLYKIFERC